MRREPQGVKMSAVVMEWPDASVQAIDEQEQLEIQAEIDRVDAEIEEKEIIKELLLSELDAAMGNVMSFEESKADLEKRFGFKICVSK
jgi:predicted methyltransferase MtxX (methanogen marker protein 4)